MCARVLVMEVVDVAGGDERELGLIGEPRELGVDPLLGLEARVLDLDVGGVVPEDLHQAVEVRRRVVRPVLLQRPRDPPREAAGEGDQALRVAFEQLPVDARLVVVTLEIRRRGELDQVPVALVRLRQERQMGVPLGLRTAVVADVHLAADNRLDPLLLRLLIELDRAGQRAVVGQRHGRHFQLGRAGGERGNPAGPVQDRILGVDVQVDELLVRHRRTILRWGQDRKPTCGGLALLRRFLTAA